MGAAMTDEQRKALARWVEVAAEQAMDAAKRLKLSDAPEAVVHLQVSIATLARAQGCLRDVINESACLKLSG